MAMMAFLRQIAGRSAMFAVYLMGFGLFASEAWGASERNPAWPASIWIQASTEPRAFPSEGRQHLFYEIFLTNFGAEQMTLTAVDVLDPSLADAQAKPLAHFAGQQLGDIAQPFNRAADTADADRAIVIGPGQALALFMEVTIPQSQAIPRVLRQRLTYADGTVEEGGTVKTSSRPLKILGAPVIGGEWTAADGPSNDRDNHHRRGLFVVDSAMTDSRRFAIDWKIMHGNMS